MKIQNTAARPCGAWAAWRVMGISVLVVGMSAGEAAYAAQETPTTPASPDMQETAAFLPVVTVTGTREARSVLHAPSAVGVIDSARIRQTAPVHPGQLLGQVPGVALAVTQGEGHTTAIRQPLTTAPVYGFLEDGIPIRATGFFNHNALYEVNVPQAGGVEITRGPGTALHGSDAVAGIVNVLTRAPATQPGADIRWEVGGAGWQRLLFGGDSGTQSWGALRGDANLTRSDGWRDATGYERQSGTLRWDAALGDATVMRSVFAFSRIDQRTGANSPVPWEDLIQRPTLNYRPIAYRTVDAVRWSTRFEREWPDALLTVTPYLRANQMDLLASFNLPSDPTLARTGHRSFGVVASWRQDGRGAGQPRLILGLDAEVSPGTRTEDRLTVMASGSGARRVYRAYQTGARVYDYQVTFRALSPYVHGEWSPTPALRVTAGLRWDHLTYRLENQIDQPFVQADPGAFYGQVPSTSLDYTHRSPKLAATWQWSPQQSAWVSYGHGFRAPSESQLFRPTVASSVDAARELAMRAPMLAPVKADQLEFGLRRVQADWSWEWVVYELEKRDDLVTQRDLVSNRSVPVNAGRTRHRGMEFGWGWRIGGPWRVDGAVSYARHTYVDWVTAQANFSGQEMESAPRLIAQTRMQWEARPGCSVALEWVHWGRYWLEASHDSRFGQYPGHDLLHLQTRWALAPWLGVFGRVHNLSDARWADSAAVSSNTAVYSPGQPRTLYAGVEGLW
jgi:iron complex outermembrane receptor protein